MKVTFSHDYNEVTGEPTIITYISIVMKVSIFVWNSMTNCFALFPTGKILLQKSRL